MAYFAGSGLETTTSGAGWKGRGRSAMPPATATTASETTVAATALRETRRLSGRPPGLLSCPSGRSISLFIAGDGDFRMGALFGLA